jgi:hypothetical protein
VAAVVVPLSGEARADDAQAAPPPQSDAAPASATSPVEQPPDSVEPAAPGLRAGASVGIEVRAEAAALLKHYALAGGGSEWLGGPGGGARLALSGHFRPPADVMDDSARWLDFEVGAAEALHAISWSWGGTSATTLAESETSIEFAIHYATGTVRRGQAGASDWAGVSLGVAWLPTYVYFFGTSTTASGGQVNPAGLQLTADWGLVGASGRASMVRLAFTWLADVGAVPTALGLGVGYVYY